MKLFRTGWTHSDLADKPRICSCAPDSADVSSTRLRNRARNKFFLLAHPSEDVPQPKLNVSRRLCGEHLSKIGRGKNAVGQIKMRGVKQIEKLSAKLKLL
jgi:hypothetical protein